MVPRKRGFRLMRRGELAYLQSPLLEECEAVDHAFSTRLGGCSDGAMAALNTAYHTGDRFESVLENRRRFLERFGYLPQDVVAGIQVHGTGIARVTAADRGRGSAPGTFRFEADALVTAEPGVALTAYAADCLLLFLVEPHIPVIALAHAGWRGTCSGMAGLAVAFLQKHYRVDPGRLRASISPGICPRCYPVDAERAGRFIQAGWGGAPYLLPRMAGGFGLDLSSINRDQLLQVGLKEENIAPNSWCTSCRADLFYSYRRESGVTGRMMGFLAIRGKRGGAI